MVPRSRVSIVFVLLLAAASAAWAQRFRVMEGPGMPLRFPPHNFSDGGFTTCKWVYTSNRREANGFGWSTDYPFSGLNLMLRSSELTKTRISKDKHGDANYWTVRLTDEALFECPLLLGSDVGTVGLAPIEVTRLREYLLKGGFLWVDDFWGTSAWERWTSEIGRVLPSTDYPIKDVSLGDPLLRSLFTVTRVPQITNIQFWRNSRGENTSERGMDSIEPHLRAIRDEHGRIMVLMTHNTDVADSWEREGEDPGFFYQFSPNGYALGVDVLLHAMTH